MNECKCDMRTKLVGDGCYVCNPQLARDIAIDNLLDEKGLLCRSEEEVNNTNVWTIVETGPWWMDLKCTKCGRLWEFTTEEAINAINFLECKCGEEDHSVEG